MLSRYNKHNIPTIKTEMSMSSVVSVVIPTYERPEFLEGAIETALGQTYDDIEVIVVDDGSEEAYAEEITSRYPDSVRCVHHDENRGLSAARNTGIEAASAEYIAFLDDDDRWHSTKIERQVAALEMNERAGLASCLVVSMTPEGDLIHCEASGTNGDCSERILVGNVIGTPSRILVRSECFDQVGAFDESLPTKQDWDFYIRLCQRWLITTVEQPLCFRTAHDSMSSNKDQGRKDAMRIRNKHRDILKEKNLWDESLALQKGFNAKHYLKTGDRVEARAELMRAIKKKPNKSRFLLFISSFLPNRAIQILLRLKRRVNVRRNCPESISQQIQNYRLDGDE